MNIGSKSYRDGDIPRRSFLGYIIAAVAGFVSTVMAAVTGGFVVSPALATRKQEGWVKLGPVSEFKPGQPRNVEFSALRKDGWMEQTVQRVVWVSTQDGENFTVWNARCTHLGCLIYWDDKDRKLKSPCHGGVFDPVDGRVLAGPPPRPLDTLPVKVEDGYLYCIYKDFRLGIPEKVEV